jgi:hypothetical protein
LSNGTPGRIRSQNPRVSELSKIIIMAWNHFNYTLHAFSHFFRF